MGMKEALPALSPMLLIIIIIESIEESSLLLRLGHPAPLTRFQLAQ